MGQWFSSAPAAATPPSDINKQPCPVCATCCTRDPTKKNTNRIVCQKCAHARGPERAAFCWDCLQPWRGTDSTCGNPDCNTISSLRQLASCPTKTIGRMSNVPELRACPQCGVLASHEDGYKHMRCLVCACEFCFVCLQTKNESGGWRCKEVCPVEKRQTSLSRDAATELSSAFQSTGQTSSAPNREHAARECRRPLRPLPGLIELTTEPCCLSLDDDTTAQRAKMPCGHVVGVTAMKQHFDWAMQQRHFEIRCPACSTVWDFVSLVRHVLSAVMSDDELQEATRQISLNLISVGDSKNCPRCQTLCERDLNTYDLNENKNRAVCQVCTRNNDGRETAFCWKCLEPWPAGLASCSTKGCDKEHRQRLLAECNTKTIGDVDGCPVIRACPRCGTLISHTGGCKHMACAGPKCRRWFCFVCLELRKDDGSYDCGAYDDPCNVAPRQIVKED